MTSENEASKIGIVIAVGFALVFFPALWMFVGLILSRISGWHGLAAKYRMDAKFAGPTWTWQTGHMRLVGFRNTLTVGTNRQGLYLAVLFPFRFQHPPLFVPWSDITVTPKRGLFIPGMQFLMGPAPGVPLWLSAGLAEKVRQASV